MPISKGYLDAALARLQGVRNVRSRKMFGGAGLYCDDVFFAVIDDDRLYFKTDARTAPAYEEAGMAQWTIEGPSGGTMPYHEVPPAVLADDVALGEWIDAAVAVSLAKKRPKKG